ncbi:hypothetical protein BP5796_09843 [Coleophoma crateriformis]|uniref:NB-ARC domain-containing protein n=1 Tax=Coleophoma crateriformis TaxID=565419 RepID=A0A3D8QTY8_9HELO|nr:hypothetical protein BP5796_09843 [Coleophoma crateriformis]
MIFLIPTVLLALLIASLWSTNHYWRNLIVSWLATLGLTYFAFANYHDVTLMEQTYLFTLAVILLLWSILLTPMQLFVSTPEKRQPRAHVEILWDPICIGLATETVQADIIAVHGLGANAVSTWIDPVSGTHWLRDILPREFKESRIILVNHNTEWDAYAPIQSLRDYGQTILNSFSRLRVSEAERKRPLVLIGHSFGGILIKKALVLALEHSNDLRIRSVADAVGGVFFFGTPHKGSNLALLGILSSHFFYWRGSRSNLLEFVTPSSKQLEDLHLSFLTSYRYVYMCNLFETQEMKLFGVPLSLVVSKKSAVFDGHSSVALNANHRNMQKFTSDKDPNYHLFLDSLKEAMRFIKERATHDRSLQKYAVAFCLKGAPLIGNFIGRARQLQQMKVLLGLPHEMSRRRILVLHGLGGIGKTQLAIEYAFQNRRNYTAIFWTNGKTKPTLRDSIAALAEQINLPNLLDCQGRLKKGDSSIDDAITAVMSWFAKANNTKWLLVIDNVEDQAINPVGSDTEHVDLYDIRQYFPSNTYGSIILTTRLSRLCRLGLSMEVTELDPEESFDVLCQASGRNVSEEGKISSAKPNPNILTSLDSRAIAERLHGLPLALCHAGAYINESGISPRKYLEKYKEQSSLLLKQDDPLTYEYGSILSTWEISFTAITSRNLTAGKMLMLWAFLDNFDVWWELLHDALKNKNELAWYQHLQLPNSCLPGNRPLVGQNCQSTDQRDWLTAVASDETLFMQAVKTLRDYSFVRVNGNDSFSIHPVVHEWASSRQDRQVWHANLDMAILVVGRALPLAHHKEAWILQRRLAPCVNQIITTIAKADISLLSAYDGMLGLAFYEFDRSHFASAEKFYEIIIPGFERVWGPEHPKTVKAVHDRALCYRVLGKYEKAESAWKWTLAVTTRVSGPVAELSLRAMDDLGRVYMIQGRAMEAHHVLSLALEGKQKTQPNILETFDTMRQLGLACQQLSRLDEAHTLHHTAWKYFDKNLGPEHTWTLLSLRDLSVLQRHRGNYEEAIVILQNALQTMERQLGGKHNYVLEMLQDLAEVYEAFGKF